MLGGVSTCQGETGAFFWRRERVLTQRAFAGARLGIGEYLVNRFQHVLHLPVYLLIPEPHYSITLLCEVSASRNILLLILRLRVLTAVEFDYQPAAK